MEARATGELVEGLSFSRREKQYNWFYRLCYVTSELVDRDYIGWDGGKSFDCKHFVWALVFRSVIKVFTLTTI